MHFDEITNNWRYKYEGKGKGGEEKRRKFGRRKVRRFKISLCILELSKWLGGKRT